MNQDGKTLLELLVVVGIIGLVSMLAVPNFLTLNSRTQVRYATEEIASDLRLARQLAITHRDRVRITVDAAQHALITKWSDETTHHVYRYGEKGLVMEEPSAGPEILFHPSGRSATATTIQLRNKEGQTQKLTVSLAGRVSIL